MPPHNSCWNLNSSWSKRTIKTRDCIRRICSKKAKTTPSVEKVMANVFWKALGIIFIDFLQKGKTIIGLNYASLVGRLNEKNKRKIYLIWQKKKVFTKTIPIEETTAYFEDEDFYKSCYMDSIINKSWTLVDQLHRLKRKLLKKYFFQKK